MCLFALNAPVHLIYKYVSFIRFFCICFSLIKFMINDIHYIHQFFSYKSSLASIAGFGLLLRYVLLA